jgi:HEAT repeat protein
MWALRELLQDGESRVRYRAVETIGVDPELVTAFRKDLERIMGSDENSAVIKAASRTLK